MSTMINVDGSDDPSYRYKMPRMLSKVEGRGNGVKTVLVNCTEVAQSLHRSTAQVCKYFGCELGAMTNYEKKADKALVNGSFVTSALQEALTGYIAKFVLCPSCGNPETVQQVKGKKKSATVFLNCKACGACEEADNAHKLITFIVKEIGDAKGKKKKKKEKDSDEKEEKKKKKSKKKRKPKKLDEDVDQDVDESSKKEAEEEEDLGFGALTVHDIAALNAAVEKVCTSLEANEAEIQLLATLEKEQSEGKLRRAERVAILSSALLTPTKDGDFDLKRMLNVLPTLSKVVEGVKDCFLSSQDIEVELLVSMEESVARLDDSSKEQEKALQLVPIFLKGLYDEDLVEEETILKWFNNALDKQKYSHSRCVVSNDLLTAIRKKAAPIIEWLQQDDDDEDESSEDEEEES